MRVVVVEWARRHVVPSAATRTFIDEVHADAVRVQSSERLCYFGRSQSSAFMHRRVCSCTQNGSCVSQSQTWRRRCSIPKWIVATTARIMTTDPLTWGSKGERPRVPCTGLDIGETTSRPRVLLYFQRACPQRRVARGRCCRGGCKCGLCLCGFPSVFARVGSCCVCAPVCVCLRGRV